MLSKLPSERTTLWKNPTNQFVLRFKDLNEFKQTHLANRIKKCARQKSIREKENITTEIIFQTLLEINPIIFSEGKDIDRGENHYRTNTEPHQRSKKWNQTECFAISGWNFKNLCEGIYVMICLDRPLTGAEKYNILRLSCGGIKDPEMPDYHRAIEDILERNENNEIRTTNIPITEMGTPEITNAREETERRNERSGEINERQTRQGNTQPIFAYDMGQENQTTEQRLNEVQRNLIETLDRMPDLLPID